MNTQSILTQVGQITTDINSSSLSAGEAAAAVAVFSVFIFIYAIVGIAVYVISALLLGRIFKKAGLAQWAAWVPLYNTWKIFELGGQSGALSIFLYIPFINIVGAIFMYIAMYNIGLKLQKSGVFVLWAIFLPVVWLIWLAVDSSKWDDAKGRSRLTTEPKPKKA